MLRTEPITLAYRSHNVCKALSKLNFRLQQALSPSLTTGSPQTMSTALGKQWCFPEACVREGTTATSTSVNVFPTFTIKLIQLTTMIRTDTSHPQDGSGS